MRDCLWCLTTLTLNQLKHRSPFIKGSLCLLFNIGTLITNSKTLFSTLGYDRRWWRFIVIDYDFRRILPSRSMIFEMWHYIIKMLFNLLFWVLYTYSIWLKGLPCRSYNTRWIDFWGPLKRNRLMRFRMWHLWIDFYGRFGCPIFYGS